jgi:hypothetical protein
MASITLRDSTFLRWTTKVSPTNFQVIASNFQVLGSHSDELIRKAQENRKKKQQEFDLYDKDPEYTSQIIDEEPESKTLQSFSAPKDAFADVLTGETDDPFKDHVSRRIADRESSYQAQRTKRELSPDRVDPFAKKQSEGARSYKQVFGANLGNWN